MVCFAFRAVPGSVVGTNGCASSSSASSLKVFGVESVRWKFAKLFKMK